jgi:NADPH:quinone reductase-like Zn-dependent oxidoreductase
MRAMSAEGFSGDKELKLVDIPKPAVSGGRVLVRIKAAGVTPLESARIAIAISVDRGIPEVCSLER